MCRSDDMLCLIIMSGEVERSLLRAQTTWCYHYHLEIFHFLLTRVLVVLKSLEIFLAALVVTGP